MNQSTLKPSEKRVNAEFIDHSLRQSPVSLMTPTVMMFVAWLVMWGKLPPLLLGSWLVLATGFAVARVLLLLRYRRQDDAARDRRWRFWKIFYYVSNVGWGVVWAVLLPFAFPVLEVGGRMALMIVMLGMSMFGALYGGSAAKWLIRTAMGATGVCWLLWGGSYSIPMSLMCGACIFTFEAVTRRQVAYLREKATMVAGLDERNTQLAAVSKAKTQLLATASHDVRQPIHAIGMLLDDWLPDASKEEHAHRIGVVRARIASISDMLQGLLDMSRLDLGVLKTTIRPVDLGAFMRGQAVAHAVSMQRKALAFTVDTSAVDGLLINTDIGLLGRILSNLLDNAYKYTWQGSVRLVGYRAPNGDACVSVIDTGIGIPESEQENIFGEYVRLSERHRDTDGVGIGLAVVTKGAALLGCHVEVQSLMDKGSTFTLVIPSTSFAHSAPTLSPQPTSPAAPAPTQTALGILLIEDDADTLAWTMRVLQRSGHETVGAQDVEAALERLRGGFVPHAVVSDFRLASHVNGVESIGQVRAYLGEPSLPAILLTGDLTVQVRRLAHEANVAVLHKPLAPARLLDAIQTLSLASPRQMAPSP